MLRGLRLSLGACGCLGLGLPHADAGAAEPSAPRPQTPEPGPRTVGSVPCSLPWLLGPWLGPNDNCDHVTEPSTINMCLMTRPRPVTRTTPTPRAVRRAGARREGPRCPRRDPRVSPLCRPALPPRSAPPRPDTAWCCVALARPGLSGINHRACLRSYWLSWTSYRQRVANQRADPRRAARPLAQQGRDRAEMKVLPIQI